MTPRNFSVSVFAAILAITLGCNPKQTRADKVASIYAQMLNDCIQFNESYKASEAVKTMPGFENLMDQTTAQFKADIAKVQELKKNLNEDALLNEIGNKSSAIEGYPKTVAFANGVSGIPTNFPSKHEIAITAYTDAMAKVITPRVQEIRTVLISK